VLETGLNIWLILEDFDQTQHPFSILKGPAFELVPLLHLEKAQEFEHWSVP